MDLIVAHTLTLRAGVRTLLADADFTLRGGDRLGLTGANGAGKSTLLAVLAGERAPDGGRLRRAPGVRATLLRQHDTLPSRGRVADAVERALLPLREAEARLRREERRLAAHAAALPDGSPTPRSDPQSDPQSDPLAGPMTEYGRATEAFERLGGYRAEAELWATLARLGVPESWATRPLAALSGGERRRLALALALASRPELLLLDEPSNHLDLRARTALGEELARFGGALLLASHDRALLDAATHTTWFLAGARLEREAGGYSAARARREGRERGRQRRAREDTKEAARLEAGSERLTRFGNAGAQRRRRRMERRLADLASRALASGRTLANGAPDLAPDLALGRAGDAASAGRLDAERLTRLAPDGALFRDVAVRLDPGDKLLLLGGNGVGKSTLLAMLAGELDSDDPRVVRRYGAGTRLLHLDQRRRGLDPGVPPLTQLERWVSAPRARQLLALAGLPQERGSAPPEQLSGGERARAALALLAATQANLLLLDEPDTGLDLPALERLESLLAASDATLVLVTHDRRLAEGVLTRSASGGRVAALQGGELLEYRGGVAGFLAGRRRLEPGPPANAPAPAALRPTATDGAKSGGSGAPANELEPELEADLEAGLEALEDARAALEEALLDPLAWSERERVRLAERHRAVMDALSERYDAALPPPRPELTVTESGVRFGAERPAARPDAPGGAPALRVTPLDAAGEPAPEARVQLHGDVAHLSLAPAPGTSLLPWGAAALADAAARCCMYLLAPRALQLQWPQSLPGSSLQAAGDHWWLLERGAFERLEGWVRPPPRGRSRRLRHHPEWRAWVAWRARRRRRS